MASLAFFSLALSSLGPQSGKVPYVWASPVSEWRLGVTWRALGSSSSLGRFPLFLGSGPSQLFSPVQIAAAPLWLRVSFSRRVPAATPWLPLILAPIPALGLFHSLPPVASARYCAAILRPSHIPSSGRCSSFPSSRTLPWRYLIRPAG